jgi:hypothetical protein
MSKKEQRAFVQGAIVFGGICGGLAIAITLLYTPEQGRQDRAKVQEYEDMRERERSYNETYSLYNLCAPHISDTDGIEAAQFLIARKLLDKSIFNEGLKLREANLKILKPTVV